MADDENQQRELPASKMVTDARNRYDNRRSLGLKIGLASGEFTFIVVFEAAGLLGWLDKNSSQGEIITFCIANEVLAVSVGFFIVYQTWFRTIRFKCRSCGKALRSDDTWVCGFCDRKVRGYDGPYSLLDKCPGCRTRPKALKCLHCGTSIFFDKDFDDRHAAVIDRPEDGRTAKLLAKERERREELRLQEKRDREEELARLVKDTELTEKRAKLAVAQMNFNRLTQPKIEIATSAIDKMMSEVRGVREKQEALNMFEAMERKSILDRNDLSEEQKAEYVEELMAVIEQARITHL